MWVWYPAISLAMAHIAGGNLAVVPDMAGILGIDIYVTTILAYLIFGSILTGILSWIGIRSGQELIIAIHRMFGCSGKKAMALLILSISIPASALTGGYFAGWIVHVVTGIPHMIAASLCLILFSLLAAGYGQEILMLSHYIGLLLLPMVTFLFLFDGFGNNQYILNIGNVDWVLVCALLGYNAGGLHSVLVVETAAYLVKQGYKAIILMIDLRDKS